MAARVEIAIGEIPAKGDEIMADVGRPPDIRPDKGLSWADRVVGGGGGRILNPASVVDAEFVNSWMRLEFLNLAEGEPVVTLDQEVLDTMNGLWQNCMFVKVLGRSVSLQSLTGRLRDLWKPKGGMCVTDLPRHFSLVLFDDKEDYLAAVTDGPWRVFGSYLLIQAWSPEFNPHYKKTAKKRLQM